MGDGAGCAVVIAIVIATLLWLIAVAAAFTAWYRARSRALRRARRSSAFLALGALLPISFRKWRGAALCKGMAACWGS
jgi:hypothetical protein